MTVKLKVSVADLHPTNIIARLRALPRWQIAGAACLIAVVGSSMGVALTRYTTHARGFCLSCHQYQRIGFEGQSTSHPSSVVCADCHQEGHSILPTQFSADSGNVRVQCVSCHEEIVTDEQRNYKYNIEGVRITHASHLARSGVTCTTCHYNVAHDQREQPTNRPTMERCFICHEAGERDCTTCHPQGTLRLPEEGGSLEAATCSACHLDWEARVHDVDGESFRHGPHLAAELLCEGCHSSDPEHGQMILPTPTCSVECHQLRPLSHESAWSQRHGADFQAEARDCAQCHAPEFCAKCHGLEMPHPDRWRTEHAPGARQVGRICARCHEPASCDACHQTMKPATHIADWVGQHQHTRPGECAQCHAQSFCTDCHAGKRPASHGGDWVSRHAERARTMGEVCSTCHGTDFCRSCHGGIDMPHPSDWLLAHKGGASFARGSVCYRCHEYGETCALCHGEKPPEDS
jgi:nitrate/TMAO reductase-like tetraheme cytochrome c subunit